ncbi:YbgF trimerization domain-containing protein [Methylotenera mobilis]|uniref:Cell division coordinator CpoB n=1 Tax=Methylotenera mobilis (strain JLW8 / ATCC BAA-1282 / DSM 17540) TaxID=583345 RepID=C6WZ31_METML|nr:YbgF trimerization domain-containing protein [Methylotenera mobilis]ACT48979.1 tol-pal system protein YbgF [Methylotenera mobilis JLW8]
MMKNLILSSLFLTTQLFSISGHSALFDDDEARKKILEVEKTAQSQNQATQSALKDLKQSHDSRLTTLEAITKNGFADMQSQIDALKQENARLKGDLEIANHKVETALQRQKDLYTDSDERLRKLESAPAAAAAPVAAVAEKNTQEYQLLELANGLSKESKHKDAFNTYDKFLKDYPNSSSASEAMYGLGYSQFALKNYKSSIATQQKLIDTYADSPKVPDAMFNMANSQIQLGLVPGAKKTLRDLIAKFPNSELTPAAQKRLKALEAIK